MMTMVNICKVGHRVALVGNKKHGDIELKDGQEVQVDHVLCQGVEDRFDRNKNLKKGYPADITVCRVMENGQVLTRSPVNIGINWRNLDD